MEQNVLEVLLKDKRWIQIKKPVSEDSCFDDNLRRKMDHCQEIWPDAVYCGYCRIDANGKFIAGSDCSVSYRGFNGF